MKILLSLSRRLFSIMNISQLTLPSIMPFLIRKLNAVQDINGNLIFSLVLTRHAWLKRNAKSSLLLNCCLQNLWHVLTDYDCRQSAVVWRTFEESWLLSYWTCQLTVVASESVV
jgi:hypothetical protein